MCGGGVPSPPPYPDCTPFPGLSASSSIRRREIVASISAEFAPLMIRLNTLGRSETSPSSPSSWREIWREIWRVSWTDSKSATASLEVNAKERGHDIRELRGQRQGGICQSLSQDWGRGRRRCKERTLCEAIIHLLQRLDRPIRRPVDSDVSVEKNEQR